MIFQIKRTDNNSSLECSTKKHASQRLYDADAIPDAFLTHQTDDTPQRTSNSLWTWREIRFGGRIRDMSMQVFSTPLDLADAISNWLNSPRTDELLMQMPKYIPSLRNRLPNRDVPISALASLCQTLYMASVATEEGEFVRIELVYIDPDQVEERVDASWRVFSFAEPLPLTLPNLIKLAPASDPRNSSVAAFHDSEGAYFYGVS